MEYIGSLGEFLILAFVIGLAIHGVILSVENAWLAFLDTVERVFLNVEPENPQVEEVNS
jgi:hypothetical protein